MADSDPIDEPGDGGSGATAIASAAPTHRLTGEFQHRVDAKGRFVLPATFRPAFAGTGGHLQVWQNTCLALLTASGFEAWTNHVRRQVLAQGAAATTSVSAAMRGVYRAAENVEPDGQGRFIIPPRFRELIPLNREVVVIGALDRVEIWLPEALDADDPSAANVLEIIQDGYEGFDR